LTATTGGVRSAARWEFAMKTIDCFNNLWEHGIRCLTGEACRVGARVLCDLTPDGVATLCDFWGLHYERGKSAFQEPWNGDGAVASVMLMHDMVPMIGVWALMRDKRCVGDVLLVTNKNGGKYATRREIGESVTEFDRFVDWIIKTDGHARRFRVNEAHPGEGTRNTHAMSGRTA
jgi:hypothetical protein